MTATMEKTTNAPGGLLNTWRNLRTPVRWMLYAFFAIFVLTIVQGLPFDDTERLTAGATASAMLRRAVPIMLAGLGGLVSERAGVVNIGLDGMMILGTWFGAYGALEFGPWGGIALGLVGGAVGGIIHAVATVSFGVDHIISGVAINIVSLPVARYLSDQVFSGYAGGSISQSPSVDATSKFSIPVLAGGFGGPDLLAEINDWDIPVLSNIADFSHGLFADVTWFTALAYALVPAVTWLLWRTRFGLRLRSCGEHPTAADSLGIDVYFYKYAAVVMSGALAGMGGAYIAIEQSNIYKEGQVAGRGFIGLATVIFGNWRPAGTALGAALFGYIDALKLIDIEGSAIHAFLLVIVLCLSGVAVWAVTRKSKVDAVLAGVMATAFLTWYVLSDTIPSPFVKVAPYAIVLLVLVFASQRLRMPKADGLPWRKGDH